MDPNYRHGDTSPSIVGGNLFTTTNAVPTLIDSFTDGKAGQLIEIRVNDSNTSFIHGSANI